MKIAALMVMALSAAAFAQSPVGKWPVHDTSRPVPRVVDPGPPGPQAPAPSDAIVLMNGKDVAGWQTENGQPAKWTVRDGYAEIVKGGGTIMTTQKFGDAQLHVEWMSPSPAEGLGQDRGNSGVYMMEQYEVQVLDSYQNRTYADGQAAALYGQFPPLVNASRPPGQWQTYDIVFHGPRFDIAGKLLRPARITVVHNGVLVQDNVELTGPTAHMARPPYKAHPARLSIMLQDHGHPVRYRNIWLRELPE